MSAGSPATVLLALFPPASSGAPHPSLPPPLGVHVRHAPQPQDNALRSASPVQQKGLSTILHGTTTRQARHRKTGIKARQRAILAEAHAKKRFPRRSLFKVLSQADNIASALGNALPCVKQQAHFSADPSTASLRILRAQRDTFATGTHCSPPFPVKRGNGRLGPFTCSLCPRSRGVTGHHPRTRFKRC